MACATKHNTCNIALLFLISPLFIPAFHFCAGQIFLQQANFLIRQQAYRPAVDALKKAEQWLPKDSAVQHSLGVASLALAWRTEGLFQKTHYSLAVKYFKEAAQLNPLEPEYAFSLARIIELQEKSRPDDILAAYRRAADLSPNSVQYLEQLADKLAQFGRQDDLLTAAERLGHIAPNSYSRIRSKPWWNPAVEKQFARGLAQAASQGTDARTAQKAAADIIARQGDWAAAAEQQRLALTVDPQQNSRAEYSQLAAYYLHSKNLPSAFEALLIGAEKEASAAAVLQSVVAIFYNAGQQAALPELYRLLRAKRAFSYAEDIYLAELLIQRRSYDFAAELLNQVIAERDYLPKPWLLLAEIYRRQQKTANMDAALAKARLRMEKFNSDNTAPAVRLPLPRQERHF